MRASRCERASAAMTSDISAKEKANIQSDSRLCNSLRNVSGERL